MRSIYRRQSQFVIAGKGNPVDESKLQIEAARLGIRSAYGLVSYPEWTKQLQGQKP